MKIIASVPSYHERLFLDYSIRAIYDHVDEIILTDTGMHQALLGGFRHQSSDGTNAIINQWRNDKKIHVIQKQDEPKTFAQLMSPALELAKELKGDWFFTVGADEIWSKQSLIPLRRFLENCEKHEIYGLNVWMYIFAPDFWNYKDFRNPRFARITDDCEMSHGDSIHWPKLGIYQFAGNTIEAIPPGTPEHVARANSDYPKLFKAFHYSCVGEERVKFKAEFYQKYNGTYGDKYVEAYMKKDWKAFREMGYKPFTGRHPEIMLTHPLYNERLVNA
jgi:glycosyltransferase involved in cell wall biosynthesis